LLPVFYAGFIPQLARPPTGQADSIKNSGEDIRQS
jgi:hypothetical protein